MSECTGGGSTLAGEGWSGSGVAQTGSCAHTHRLQQLNGNKAINGAAGRRQKSQLPLALASDPRATRWLQIVGIGT